MSTKQERRGCRLCGGREVHLASCRYDDKDADYASLVLDSQRAPTPAEPFDVERCPKCGHDFAAFDSDTYDCRVQPYADIGDPVICGCDNDFHLQRETPSTEATEGETAGCSDKTISSQFHKIWTSQVGTDGYNKRDWQELRRLLDLRGIRV